MELQQLIITMNKNKQNKKNILYEYQLEIL